MNATKNWNYRRKYSRKVFKTFFKDFKKPDQHVDKYIYDLFRPEKRFLEMILVILAPPLNFSQPSVGLLVPGSNRRETSEKLSEMRLQLLRGGRRRRDTSGVQKLFFSSSPLLLFLLQCRKASKNESFVGKTSLLLVWVRLLRTLFIASSSIYYMSCFSKKAEENVKEGSCDFLRNCKENSQPPFSLAAVQPDQAIPFQNSNSVHFCFRCMRNVKHLPDDKTDSRFCSNDYL